VKDGCGLGQIWTNKVHADGRPCLDRQWKECYAQLVGTVLSLWDATALDGAGGQEVPATFINVADASIKMVPALELPISVELAER
jgi:CCR4-NOT transcriptional complex subunit CAF120